MLGSSGWRQFQQSCVDKNTFRRFTPKVMMPTTPDGCMEWTGAKSDDGYGFFYKNGKMVRAHRVSYEHFVGPIPDGHVVRHKCDTPSCVRPDHLETGTKKDNARDCITRGRNKPTLDAGLKGAKCPWAKLTEAQVHEIRSLYADGNISQRKLAQKYGVCQQTVSLLICISQDLI